MQGPTPRQRDVLGFIRLFIAVNKFPPSIREIGAGVGLSSTSTIQHHLVVLEQKGLIERRLACGRTITLREAS